MSSTPETNSDDDDQNDERLINALSTREIRRGLLDSDIDVGENADREEVFNLLETHPAADQLREDIVEGAKKRILEDGHVKHDSIEGTGQGIPVISDALTLAEVYYYDSYFQYTDHTARVYEAPDFGGVLRDIAEDADSPAAARNLFMEFCESEDVDPAYIEATEDVPAPLIDNTDDQFSPRLVKFEDANTIYLEYWKRGKTMSEFDVRTGDYEKIKTLYRAVVRVNLDTGLIETMGDNSQQSNEQLVKRFLGEFSGSDTVRRINIRGPDIRRTKSDLALLTSLNEFVGEEAKVRLTRNQSGNVEADPAHDQMESERDYSKTNFQIFIGETADGWELVYPRELGEEPDSEDEVTTSDVLTAIDESSRIDYEDVKDLTITLDGEKSTYRIQKKDLAPSTREQVFDLLAEELGWISD
ncbi:hypothetical protein [Natrinema salifodinae]|uniref:Uncharacterized protein n=1 Tax=Natrinema salifodinae TaxID=1202768 RepID=A0A1I0NC13_9EURY|nr:hypothetical protein [Natrinema salifodinae]SEV98425.1 hypothetical protein SAMN05216285_1527 [Natrinema salifodinae]